jgi:hypothetical protein
MRVLPPAFRGQLAAAYGLLTAESLLRLAQPLMIGLAINDLIASSFRGLLLFAGGFLALTLTAAVGEMVRTRVFASLHARLLAPRRPDADSVSAVSQSPSKMLEWLERILPDQLHTFVSVGGSLLLLGWYDLTLIPFGLLLIAPFWLMQAASEPGAAASHQSRPQRRTTLKEIDEAGHLPQYLEAERSRRVRLSDTAAIRVALTELFVLGMLASAIVHFLGLGAAPPPAGDVFAVVCYLLLFAAGLRSASAWRLRQQPEELSMF